MPYGTPYTFEERKARHLGRYGTLENFPEIRRGRGVGMGMSSLLTSQNIILAGAGLLIGYMLGKR